MGIRLTRSNTDGVGLADVVMLCVKPHQANEVLAEIEPFIHGKILISAVTGLSSAEILDIVIDDVYVVRIMPNIAAQYGESATCIVCNETDNDWHVYVSNLLE